MLNRRDRMLATLFVVQLAVVAIFGLILVNRWSDREDTQVVAVADSTGQTATPVAGTTGGSDGATTGDGGATASSGATTGTAATTGGTGTGPADPASGGTGSTTGGDAATTGAADPGTATTGDQTGGEGVRTGVSDDSIKVGVLVTQTGAINFRGSAQATRSYFDLVNENGGVHGRRIEMVLRDDGLDANRGQAAVQEMIQEGVFAFAAFNAPLTEQGLAPILDRNNISLVGAFTSIQTPKIYMFSAPYSSFGNTSGTALGAAGVSTPALIYISNQNETQDANLERGYREGMARVGITLDDDNLFPVDVTKASYDDVVTSLRLNGVDSIASLLDSTAMIRLQQSLNRANYSPVHYASPFGGDPKVLGDPNVGATFEGMLVASEVSFLGQNAAIGQYESEVRRRFGNDALIDWAGKHGWLGAVMFVEALERAGPDPTRERLVAALHSVVDFDPGIAPPLTITAEPRQHLRINDCIQVGKVVQGKVQPTRPYECFHRPDE